MVSGLASDLLTAGDAFDLSGGHNQDNITKEQFSEEYHVLLVSRLHSLDKYRMLKNKTVTSTDAHYINDFSEYFFIMFIVIHTACMWKISA